MTESRGIWLLEVGNFDKDLYTARILISIVGQVSKNAHIDSAVTPKWRTAKTHVSHSDFKRSRGLTILTIS